MCSEARTMTTQGTRRTPAITAGSCESLLKAALETDGEDAEAVDALRHAICSFAHLVYLSGMEQATRDFAVWSGGEQLVGVLRRPLKTMLDRQWAGRFVIDSEGLSVDY